MSNKSKELYKKYLYDTENTSTMLSDKSLKNRKSISVKEIKKREIIREFQIEYTFYYNLLMASLNKHQTELLLEIDEIIDQQNYVMIDMGYMTGFEDCRDIR
jgi:hypothetical protein